MSKSPGRFTQRGCSGQRSAWESTATLRLLGGARCAGAPTGEKKGEAYYDATRTAC